MRSFKEGMEIRLQKNDLMELLTDSINDKLFSPLNMDKHNVTEVSLHPANKYVLRLVIKPRDAD